MAILALVGIGLIALGATAAQDWLVVLGVIPLTCAPFGLLVPALRISWHRRPENGYRDMHYLGGLLSILGFDAAERDAAFTREPHDSPPR